MLPIDLLFKPSSKDEVMEAILTILENMGVPARSWRVGGVLRTLMAGFAIFMAGLSQVIAYAISSHFLETGEGGWLTIRAKDTYNITRVPATFATGKVLLTNSGGGPLPFSPGELVVRHALTKKTYVNVASISVPALSSLLADFQAREIGSDSTAAPGTITEFETAVVGLTANNPNPIQGKDQQTDQELRQLCLDRLGALSGRGPRSAYAYAIGVAKRIDGTPVNINRSGISKDSSLGKVFVYLASPTGVPISDDIEAVRESIETHARPDSVTCIVEAAAPVELNAKVHIFAKKTPGLDADGLRALAMKSLVDRVRAYDIGGFSKNGGQAYFHADYLDTIVARVHESILDVDLYEADGVTVFADLPMQPNEVLTLGITEDDISVRIV